MGWGHGIVWKGAGHWSPWLYHGVPQPPHTHTPALGRPLTGLRAQVDSIWKAWLFQELLDQAGKGPEKNYVSMGGSGEKDGTQDQGFWIWVSVEDSTLPHTSLALTSHRKPHNTRGFSHTSTRVPQTFPDVLFPGGPNPKTSGQMPPTFPFEIFLLVSAQALSPTAPSICSSVQLTSFSPTCPCNLFPCLLPSPLYCSFPSAQPIRKGRQVKEGEERRLV